MPAPRMGNDHLHEAQTFDRYGAHDPYEAIKAALERLVSLARAGKIVLQGKFRADSLAKAERLRTAIIDAIEFADYRQFDILEDALCLGTGLFWDREGPSIIDHVINDRGSDAYVETSVARHDLLREFPPKAVPDAEAARFRVGHAFTRDDPARIAPWWSVNQALAWIACGIASYVEYVATLETDLHCDDVRFIMAQAIVEADMNACDEAQAFMANRRTTWPEGTVLAHAGSALLEAIQSGAVKPVTSENGRGREMRAAEFAGIGLCSNGEDWLKLDPQPLFASAEVMGAFPLADLASAQSAITITSTAGAENECRGWLAGEFAADPQKRRPKDEFRKAALARFEGRLSARGFNDRVWPALAQNDGRSGAGRKAIINKGVLIRQ